MIVSRDSVHGHFGGEVLCYSGEKNEERITVDGGPKGNATNRRRGSDKSCNCVPHQRLLL